MTTKAEKPTLQGQRIKARKRDEKAKYDPVGFRDAILHVLVYLKGFTEGNRSRLARCVAIWTSDSLLDPKVLIHLVQEHLIKDGLAVDFLCEVLNTAKELKDIAMVRTLLRKSGLDTKLMEFLPANKRTDENFKKLFDAKGLGEIVNIQKSLEKESSIKELQVYLSQQVKENAALRDIICGVQEIAKKHNIQEPQVVTTIWSSIMASVEWNKKDELVADQALRHLRIYAPLFAASTTTARGELQLLLRVQEYCYDNMNFMKVFQKIVYLFYKSEVLSEDVILKWYKDSHSAKGKSIFLVQMKKFIEWLQNAETESEDSGDEEEED
ncbi:Protein krasavietz [Armadillidium nasatum]|uniref:Protein krasavietz n=1 Tax=Armadillidium nasatum TaxID=96803 RepID=A0A5N5SM72_9CRUS|nr:Protein krasavietz [Armadillidium nasatum]